MVQSMDKERAMGIIKHEKSIEASFSFAYGFEVLEIYVIHRYFLIVEL